MHNILLVFMVILLIWFMFPTQKTKQFIVPGEEMYKNKPSSIEFPNAEFKFYK